MSEFNAKQKAIAIAPKFTSLASVLGSTFIIYDIVHDRKRRSCTIHRLLLGMSVSDFLSSSWFFMTSWPIPAGTPGVYGAIGNQATCTAQGFFSQFSLSTAVYNASLSVFYVLQIRLGWQKDRIARSAEPILHAFSLGVGLGTSFAGIGLKLYNNDMWECWIAPYPLDCKESWRYGSEGNCVRGDNASLYRWVLYYAILWAAIVVVTVCMLLVYRFVLNQEKVADRYGSHCHERKFSKKVAVQGYWYCGAFYSTWILPTITRLVQVISGNTPFWLICLTAMFVPIQGLFNFFVYMRPRYKKHKRIRRLVRWAQRIWKCSLGSSHTENLESVQGQSHHTDRLGITTSHTACSCWNNTNHQGTSTTASLGKIPSCHACGTKDASSVHISNGLAGDLSSQNDAFHNESNGFPPLCSSRSVCFSENLEMNEHGMSRQSQSPDP